MRVVVLAIVFEVSHTSVVQRRFQVTTKTWTHVCRLQVADWSSVLLCELIAANCRLPCLALGVHTLRDAHKARDLLVFEG